VTDLDVDAIKGRALLAATPGPWKHVVDSAADVPALLARIAELEAERRRSPAENGQACDVPWPGRTPHTCVLPGGHHVHWDGERDVWLDVRSEDQVVVDLAAAERRGYERAVTRLREHGYNGAADYLEATKEGNDGR